MRQFLRKARVTFGGEKEGFIVNAGAVQRHEMRVAFSVSRSISGSPNTFSISVWNLNRNHRNGVGKEFDLVTLEAGYAPDASDDGAGIIARGRIRDVQHDRAGPDIITSVSCGDGDSAYRRAVISKTYPAGTHVKDVIEGIYGELKKQGIRRGEITLPEGAKTFARPYSMCGSCTRELDVLGRGGRFYWSFQNETLEIIPADGHLPGVTLIKASSGMIGIPTFTDNGIKVTALLNPSVRPNRLVAIESDIVELNSENGLYRVSQVDFNGDNTQGDFTMAIHGEAINAGKVDQGVKS